MADIFLSYAREDREPARLLAQALEACGWTVWWDTRIQTGRRFHQIIERELAAARCVVVLWSSAANASHWVREEAQDGLDRDILVPAAIGNIVPPLGFRSLQTADLSDWGGELNDLLRIQLVNDIAWLLGEAVKSDAATPSPGAKAPPSPASGRGEEKPLPLGEVGANAPGEGADAPKPELARPPADAAASLSRERERAGVRVPAALKQQNAVYIGADWHDLPDFAVFKDIDAPWCPEMVVIPAGTFLMGSPPGEEGRRDNEGPQHRVTISRCFAIGRYAVTFDEYDHFCEATKRQKSADAGWGRGRRPVINVSWNDAQAYLAWLSDETGQPYRLPSQAEWEYACRAGTTTPFSIGATITPEQVNYNGNFPYGNAKKGQYRARTVPVGSLPANPWGLYEMHGNVWEWCHDGPRTYGGDPVTDPLGPSDIGALRVVRGGSWNDALARYVRSAFRSASVPGYRSDGIGFRVARVQDL